MSSPQPYGPPAGGTPFGSAPLGSGPPALQGRPETEAKAVVALVLAVAAYTPTVPFLGAVAALVLARMARRDILRSGGAKTGLGLAGWATGLAVLHLVLVALVLLVVLAALLLPFAISIAGLTIG